MAIKFNYFLFDINNIGNFIRVEFKIQAQSYTIAYNLSTMKIQIIYTPGFQAVPALEKSLVAGGTLVAQRPPHGSYVRLSVMTLKLTKGEGWQIRAPGSHVSTKPFIHNLSVE